MKKNLFLDLGNVVLKVHMDRAVSEIAKLAGKPADEIENNIDWQLEKKFEKGEISQKEYIDAINIFYPGQAYFNTENLTAAWEKGFTEITTTFQLLPELAEKTNLYLLSNTNEIHFSAIEKCFGISRYFKQLFLSYELGNRKPEPDIYLKTLKIAGAKPENSYFVDDLSENIEAARRLGIQAVQYTGHVSFENFLTQNSIL